MEYHRFVSQWFTIRDPVTTHTLFYHRLYFQQRRLKSKPTFKTISTWKAGTETKIYI